MHSMARFLSAHSPLLRCPLYVVLYRRLCFLQASLVHGRDDAGDEDALVFGDTVPAILVALSALLFLEQRDVLPGCQGVWVYGLSDPLDLVCQLSLEVV